MCDSYSEAEDQEGVMDNLLEALKNGSAFIVNRERKDGRKRTPRAAGGELLVFDYLQMHRLFTVRMFD